MRRAIDAANSDEKLLAIHISLGLSSSADSIASAMSITLERPPCIAFTMCALLLALPTVMPRALTGISKTVAVKTQLRHLSYFNISEHDLVHNSSQSRSMASPRRLKERHLLEAGAVEHRSIAMQLHRAAQLHAGRLVSTYDESSPNRYKASKVMFNLTRQWLANGSTAHICRLDTSVLASLAALPDQHYAIVANLHNSMPIMGHFMQQLMTTAALLPGKLTVSVYESGSTDRTPEALAELHMALKELGVASHITVRGNVTRGRYEDRIPYLARVRNAAMQPVYDSVHNSSLLKPDKVIFLNDVLFCANDILRLIVQQADMICGVDLVAYQTTSILQLYGRVHMLIGSYCVCNHDSFTHVMQRCACTCMCPYPVS